MNVVLNNILEKELKLNKYNNENNNHYWFKCFINLHSLICGYLKNLPLNINKSKNFENLKINFPSPEKEYVGSENN